MHKVFGMSEEDIKIYDAVDIRFEEFTVYVDIYVSDDEDDVYTSVEFVEGNRVLIFDTL